MVTPIERVIIHLMTTIPGPLFPWLQSSKDIRIAQEFLAYYLSTLKINSIIVVRFSLPRRFPSTLFVALLKNHLRTDGTGLLPKHKQ